MSKQNKIFTILVAVILIVAWWFLLFSPSLSTVEDSDERVQDLQDQADGMRAQLQAASELSLEQERLEDELAELRLVLPVFNVDRETVDPTTLDVSQIDYSRLVDDLTGVADGMSLTLTSAAISRPQAEAAFEELEIPEVARLSVSVVAEAQDWQTMEQFLEATIDPDQIGRGLVWRSVAFGEVFSVTDEGTETSWQLTGQFDVYAELPLGEAPPPPPVEEDPDDESDD